MKMITNFSIKTDTPVTIASSSYEISNEERIYYCNCNRRLDIMNKAEGEYFCTHCSISYYPEHQQVRSSSRLVAHEGPNENPCVSYSPEPTIDKPPIEVKGGLKVLKDKGIKITNYSENEGQ
jgi:hypothetical protein